MKIEHLAIWTQDLELVRNFYIRYFDMKCSEKYSNPQNKFSSYFLSFSDSSTRIEIMNRTDITEIKSRATSLGLTHFSISVGNKKSVDNLTMRLFKDGYTIVSKPRVTGDGYYESIIEDCEGNWIEITE